MFMQIHLMIIQQQQLITKEQIKNNLIYPRKIYEIQGKYIH